MSEGAQMVLRYCPLSGFGLLLLLLPLLLVTAVAEVVQSLVVLFAQAVLNLVRQAFQLRG